ncbi:hypothetical protein Tel_01675 [Candidatus Tenderia electrophaga]|jgi:AcrR family transcriptional regulator|uniref:HTH tetR-type domain-containing protein n=1 Tax=Candidatus Tenderia electrophaga TaxID=1748243 RepID=A0A0S2TA10_9GAMM|nr:hypothetical protein Tel_01675 [Candidatus Tenderia electrophaga]
MSKKPGLRERKFARTRLKLARALARRLEQSSLEEVAVRDLCEDAELSEATFFNYFPRKTDLLDYYTRLWMLELNWRCRHIQAQGVAAVAACFDFMAAALQQQPGVMGEIIARQALLRGKPEPVEIGLAERQIAYPDYEGIEELPAGGVDKAWLPALEQAVRSGELPPNVHLPTVMAGLASLFYGVPLVLRQNNFAAVSSMYHQQLAVFWAGIKTTARGAA